ncbi:MAG: glycosyltransferase [Saccharofermentans sp.]|nr:glycosyltransferase [Saccharofermentans sp.]
MNTDNDCRVSVMITFFNQKQYINDCLSSVLSQKADFPFEILCGDDCSTDGTYEELLKWEQQYPDVISVYQTDKLSLSGSEPIVRASNNRINLLRNAKGRYLCFLDGDDYYSDDQKLQKQYEILERFPDASACFHPVALKLDKEKQDGLWSRYSDKMFSVSNKNYWGCLWSHVQTFMFRNSDHDLVNSINKDFFDDNLITAYFIKTGRVIYTPEVMSVYRQISDSSWNRRTEFEKNYINLLVYQESKRVLPKMKKQCFIKCYDSIRFLFDNRNKDWSVCQSPHLKLCEPLYVDTVRYRESGFGFKMLYVIKWMFPLYFGKVLKVFGNKLEKCTRKYI